MSALRVAHLVASFEVGGLQKGVATLVNAGSADVEHLVISMSPDAPMAERLSRGRVETLGVPFGERAGLGPRVAALLRSFRPDVLHTRNWPTLVDGSRARKLARVAVHVHGHHGRDAATAGGFGWKRRLAGRLLSRRLQRVVTLTESMAAEWRREFGRPRRGITLIPNGVVLPEEPAPLSAAGAPFRVLAVGRLDPVKDYPTLFEAFARMEGRGPEDRLVLVGEGPEEAGLRLLARELELEGAVTWAGRVVPATPFFGHADVFVQSSIYEGMSNTVAEAMAAGLAVVATDSGGNPDVLGETGLFFLPGDVDGLARHLARLKCDVEERGRLARAARRRAEERYSVSAMVSSYETLWRELAGRHRR